MRQVIPPNLDLPASALGFGTASLGSRIAPKAGLLAVERALDAGITWFDTAPAYGDGEAEALLGAALQGVRVHLVTKVGRIAAPVPGWRRIAKLALRPVLAAAPGLRGLVRRGRSGAVRALPLSGDLIRASLETSLKRLRRDQLSALALHEPSLADVNDDGVIRALLDAKARGLIANIAIAGDAEIYLAAKQAGLQVDIFQAANPPGGRVSMEIQGQDFLVSHSVFGVNGAKERLSSLAAQDPGFAKSLIQLTNARTLDVDALLIADAFDANPRGVVLTSAYRARHLEANKAAANAIPDLIRARRLDAVVEAAPRTSSAKAWQHLREEIRQP